MNFIRPHDKRDYILPLKNFIEFCQEGDFIDYDGYGHPSNSTHFDDSIDIFPSDIMKGKKFNCTHVVWYNR